MHLLPPIRSQEWQGLLCVRREEGSGPISQHRGRSTVGKIPPANGGKVTEGTYS